eukprot:597219-Alexandrium_andersonii.AAC.1
MFGGARALERRQKRRREVPSRHVGRRPAGRLCDVQSQALFGGRAGASRRFSSGLMFAEARLIG